MSSRKGGGRTTARPFNWLKNLDEKANTLTRAGSWLQPYGPFMLARYPNLRPEPIAEKLFAEWESRIANHSETTVCLDGLNSEQRKQLSALMIEIAESFELQAPDRRRSQLAQAVLREEKRRTNMLKRKLEKARKAVEALFSYAEDSESGHEPVARSHDARKIIGQPYAIAAANALRDLQAVNRSVDVDFWKSVKDECQPLDHPESFAMVRLYWFFKHECGLTGDDSEVRTARLRNAFWTKRGGSKVDYRPEYEAAQSQGCDAVRAAVRRYPPD